MCFKPGFANSVTFQEDGQIWFVALTSTGEGEIHNQPALSEWRIPPNVLDDITQAVKQPPKRYKRVMGWIIHLWKLLFLHQIQNSCEESKRQNLASFDNEKVNPFKIIALVNSIKDGNSPAEGINKLLGTQYGN